MDPDGRQEHEIDGKKVHGPYSHEEIARRNRNADEKRAAEECGSMCSGAAPEASFPTNPLSAGKAGLLRLAEPRREEFPGLQREKGGVVLMAVEGGNKSNVR